MSIIERVPDTSPEILAPYDAIIDVRSPAEFADDHIPGAINLPVLSNDERAEVGTIYKQVSKTRARRIGAAHVARNIAGHLETWFADKGEDFRPLVYCWRGGMRSAAMASVLAQVCWRTGVLDGGYKTWRRLVVEHLHDSDAPLNIVLIDGETGTAKTEIIKSLIVQGAQALDLEGLAAHRGSVFGGLPGRPQPGQKYFESLLWDRLSRFDPSRPIFIEAESNRIGRCEIPKRLWQNMLGAKRIIVRAAPEARADYLLSVYRDMTESSGAVSGAVDALRRFHSKKRIEEWGGMADAGRHRDLAAALIEHHYDPLYQRSRKRRTDKPLAEFTLARLDPEGISDAAKRIVDTTKQAQNKDCVRVAGAIASSHD